MNNGANMPNGDTSIPPNAVSLYGQNDAMDDFPVLKAFQQYIDAEQAKAQKRMTTVCVFFAIIMAIVIGVFVMLLLNVSQHNSSLNDQLLQFMMKDRDRPAVAQTGTQDATVKMLTDSMANLQKQMSEQQMKLIEQQAKLFEQQAKAAEEKAKRASGSPSSPAVDPAVEAKAKADSAKLKKALAQLEAEKEKLAKEKEALRREKVELHRRKLYPDYYAKQEAAERRAAAPEPDDAEPDVEDEAPAPTPPPTPKPKARRAASANDDDLDELLNIKPEVRKDGSIRYFQDDETDVAPPSTPTPAPKAPRTPANDLSLSSGWEIPLN